MKNLLLTPSTTEDIHGRVERVLKGLGNPEPPLRLEDVRELLKLDRQFYTESNPGIIQESISRIRVAALQVYKRPRLLAEAIAKSSLKALYLPDRRRILLDGDVPLKKHRWNEAHEIGHSLLPWHDDLMFGDNEYTLSRECREQIEAEANYAAGQLLFLREAFTERARSMAPSFVSIKQLQGIFGNTLTTTTYRFVECADLARPMVAAISCHPHPMRRPANFNPREACRHLVQSPSFALQFRKFSEHDLFEVVGSYCNANRAGPLGDGEVVLEDDNGEEHVFHFETFYNQHDALTIGVCVRHL